ncbi:MAG TPA: tRNA (adenosine(37)-N6)-threonylcarbamoyltransferase complex ATPase subunit type 1 TsaE [Bacteroidales bacterium]|nr:tRNA (adenosine(37)-N6)-threonylcarbamoyltransferase complex ATPase subunit type 1 TsaE [Bacteroidales bacterium]
MNKIVMKKLSPTIITAKHIEDLPDVSKAVITKFPRARIFAFYGPMGAGKTTFIKTICDQLGVKDNVTSPTFSLINEYRSDSGTPVFHFDFYRIRRIEEAMDLGYEDYFYSGHYCLIEWPELIAPLLPDDAIAVTISVNEEDSSRQFVF